MNILVVLKLWGRTELLRAFAYRADVEEVEPQTLHPVVPKQVTFQHWYLKSKMIQKMIRSPKKCNKKAKNDIKLAGDQTETWENTCDYPMFLFGFPMTCIFVHLTWHKDVVRQIQSSATLLGSGFPFDLGTDCDGFEIHAFHAKGPLDAKCSENTLL